MTVLLFVCLFVGLSVGEDVFVQTNKGTLRGYTSTSTRDGTPYAGFVGIPYAQPPVGDLRFQAPREHPDWNGVRDAVEFRHVCFSAVQSDAHSEDCLFLNVFAPNYKQNSTQLKSVMLFIHGGAFIDGSSDITIWAPDFYMDHDVVFVTINYRLGPLGFLTLQTPEVPGNAGLKDQVMALKWVQENIAAFGGDPKRVTVFGNSAGGASVSYLQLSSLSKGLFSQIIHESGEALVPWAYVPPDQATTRSSRLGDIIGCNTSGSSGLLYECLVQLPPGNISYHQMDVVTSEDMRRRTNFPFAPTAEPDLPGAFITKPPIELLNSGEISDVPTIMGSVLREGLLYLMSLQTNDPNGDLFGQNMTNFIPLDLIPDLNRTTEDQVGQRIKQFYLNGEDISLVTRQLVCDLFTDTSFVMDIQRQLFIMSQYMKSPVYNYNFVYDGPFADMRLNNSFYQNVTGPMHGDELGYLMDIQYMRPWYDQYERSSTPHRVIDRMTKLWTDFAKFGNPTPQVDSEIITTQWLPFSPDKHNYLEIGEELILKQGLAGDRMKFWNDIYDEIQNRRPLPE